MKYVPYIDYKWPVSEHVKWNKHRGEGAPRYRGASPWFQLSVYSIISFCDIIVDMNYQKK